MWEEKVGCGWNHRDRHTKRQDSRQTDIHAPSQFDEPTDRQTPTSNSPSPKQMDGQTDKCPPAPPKPTHRWMGRQADRQADMQPCLSAELLASVSFRMEAGSPLSHCPNLRMIEKAAGNEERMCIWEKQVLGITSLFGGQHWEHIPKATGPSRCGIGSLCFELCLAGMRGGSVWDRVL